MIALCIRPIRLAALAALFALGPALAAIAGDLELTQITLPQPFLEDGKVNNVIEASGVEPIGNGRFLLAHDKAPALYVVELETGRILGAPITSSRLPVQNGAGPKWEGMARDSDGNFYIIGAHNGKTDDERATKSHLYRFRLKDTDPPAIDDSSVVAFHAAKGIEQALKSLGVEPSLINKRKVEGLTIREHSDASGAKLKELVIGLRAPTDKVRLLKADITNVSPDSELELKPLAVFQAEPREGVVSELTAMEYCPALEGTLVMTASEDDDNAFHGNTLWFVPDSSNDRAEKIAVLSPAMKAEGLTVVSAEKKDGTTSARLLITYDNDFHATHIPSRFQTAVLIKH